MMTLFKEQKVAMIINGPWEVNNVRQAPTFGGIENLGIAAVPGWRRQGRRPGRRPQLRDLVRRAAGEDRGRDRVRQVHELGRVAGVPGRQARPAADPQVGVRDRRR